eukprot:3950689-Amphidinium_carterae.1
MLCRKLKETQKFGKAEFEELMGLAMQNPAPQASPQAPTKPRESGTNPRKQYDLCSFQAAEALHWQDCEHLFLDGGLTLAQQLPTMLHALTQPEVKKTRI